jgi:CRP-like cAMP-binding protein
LIHPEYATSNRVLDSLSDRDFDLLEPHLERVELGFRKRLQSSNRAIEIIYFPDSGLGSVVAIGQGREAQAEVALVGCDGMTGIPIVNGTDRSPHEIFVQVEGCGRQIGAAQFRAAMKESESIRDCFLLYSQTFIMQSSYTALANAKGTLEQRLARWLLMAHDRLEVPHLILTHEFLALMMGVRRAGVTTALQHLQAIGLVRGERGSVTLFDRDGLEEIANGLYGPAEAEYERLFPPGERRRRSASYVTHLHEK